MQFSDSRIGDYRIYVGALEGGPGVAGYSAALVVMRERLGHTPEPCFRDDSLACGYRWPSAEQALAYAMARGREMLRRGVFDEASTTAAVAVRAAA